jgi:hypothetical protein
MKKASRRLPVLDHVERLHYHREPTKAEIAFGHGATHYRTFAIAEACYPGTRIARRWFKASDDGLRYYR